MAISLAAETQPPAFKLYLCIAITVFCWGYSPIGVHSALHSYTPQHIALLRFLIASVFLLLLVMKKGIQPLKWKDVPALGVLGFFSVTLHHLLINAGQQYVTAVASSILSQSIPLFTFIISALLFKEKIRFKQWLCILLGLCGAVLVVSGDHGFGVPSPYSLLIVLAAIAWGLYFNLYKKFALNYDALSMMCYIIWFGTIPLLFYSAHLPSEILHAYVLWGYVLKNMPLTIASNFLYCSPIVAMSLAVVFLNEKPTIIVLLGGAIIVGSLVWMNWANRRTIE